MTDSNDDFSIFRIRGTIRGKDHSKCAWEKRQVGVWYGAWEPEELDKAIEQYNKTKNTDVAVKYMTDRPQQKRLDWKFTKEFFHTCRRFRDITAKKDWVIVCFDGTLRLGQLNGGIKVDKKHKLNDEDGELFHFRHVINQKDFPLVELPDVYRLIAQAGRGNVHGHNEPYARLLNFLVKCGNTKEVNKKYNALLKSKDGLDLISDAEWESLCLGYLIIEYNYVPTGLLLGRTLSDYDLVGKTLAGRRIFAQCKKGIERYPVTGDFLNDCKTCKGSGKAQWFWCSYGGWTENPGYGIKLVDKACIEKWLHTERGRKYFALFGS